MRFKTIKIRHTVCAYALLAGSAVLSACGTEPTSDDLVSEEQSALGELSCTTVPVTAGQISTAPTKCATSTWLASSDANYNPSGCTNGYVGEFNVSSASLAGYTPFYFQPFWSDAPLTSSNCSQAQLALYAWDEINPPRGTLWWKAKGSVFLRGSWNGSACTFVPTTGTATAVYMTPTAGQYTVKTRAAAEATLFGVRKRVGITAFELSCIK